MARKLSEAIKELGPQTRIACVDRRQQLLEVAIKLFSKKGFKGTTTKEIALAAGVSEALVFHHFPSKDDLYTAILASEAQQANTAEWVGEFRKFIALGDDEGLIKHFVSKLIEHHRRNPDFIRLMLFAALEGHELTRLFIEQQMRPLNEFFYDYFMQRQREGLFNDYDPKVVVSAIVGIPTQYSLMEALFLQDKNELRFDELISNYAKFILDGIRRRPVDAGNAHTGDSNVIGDQSIQKV